MEAPPETTHRSCFAASPLAYSAQSDSVTDCGALVGRRSSFRSSTDEPLSCGAGASEVFEEHPASTAAAAKARRSVRVMGKSYQGRDTC